MYQRAIASVTDARDHLRAGRIRERALAIKRAYSIVTELLISLDAEKSPELAANLRRLYCYVQERLIEANLHQKDGPLEEAGRLLTTLADAWREVPPGLVHKASDTGQAPDDDASACSDERAHSAVVFA